MRLLLACLGLALCFPAPAAATPVVDDVPVLRGPFFVEGGVSWLEQDRGDWAVRVHRDGQAFTAAAGTLAGSNSSMEDPDDDDYSTGDYVAGFTAAGRAAAVLLSSSGGNAKAGVSSTSFDVRRVALEPGPGGAPPTLVACSEEESPWAGPGGGHSRGSAIATDGRAFGVEQCGKTRFFDAAGKQLAETDTPPVPDASRLALAGRFAASIAGAELVVRDWQAGTEAYRVPLPVGVTPASLGFDLQDDGALALVTFRGPRPVCGEGTLTWHTAAAPAGVALAAVPCSSEVAADGGRAAVVAEAPGGQVIAEVAPDGTRRDLAWVGTGRALTGDVDYAAGTAAYALARCANKSTLHLSSGDATPEAVDCPRLRVTATDFGRRWMRVRGKVAARVTGRLRIVFRAAGRTWRRSVRPSGGRFSLRLRIPARAVRRGGRLSVAYAGDATFLPQKERLKIEGGIGPS